MSFFSVTEQPGIRITHEGYRMLLARYSYAARLCAGRDVLEVACGAGMGLGLLAHGARSVVGGDFDETLLGRAQETYRGRMGLVRLDAHSLPFTNESFDAVLLLEAIYYLAHPENFIRECRRVLRPGGVLLICTANREWRGFCPSPFSHRYFSSEELRQLLLAHGFGAEICGGFPAAASTPMLRVVQAVRRLAVLTRLIPKTMKGKEWLKRLFYGELVLVNPEIQPGEEKPELVRPIAPGEEATRYKVLYAVGQIPATSSVVQSLGCDPAVSSLVPSSAGTRSTTGSGNREGKVRVAS